ncbi:BT4734/BF3469 family protein [Chryseobacterium sp. OV279]|uniref:BT4734/BF3469 family protein n=1 Tax=Chryseobacterium sp. OV279 TaxID=1500285 RepID=UPI00091E083D|nr:BT4734/BF3469 family protein [Chryseobacterium sp. OV279]SHE78570.1 Primase C terminal 2 (PriCT-2) [Chryseobacterium sp. OV279]
MNNIPTITNLLSSKISLQENTWSEITSEVSIINILQYIKSQKLNFKIEDLRTQLQAGNKEYYDNNKKKLPAVTFSGRFEKKRLLSNLTHYIPLITIDIDKLDNDSMIKIKSNLLSIDFVLSFWKSPSNNGFKGIVPISYNIDNREDLTIDYLHKCAFRKLSEYFLENFSIELDKSGSDITRLCFLSSDKEMVLKENHSAFEINNDDIILQKNSKEYKQILKFSNTRDALYNPANKNKPSNRKFMSDIIRFLYKKDKSLTNDYNSWCQVAMAIANTFTFDIGLKYFKKISILDKEKYNEIVCTNFLINCYETRKGEINFATIIFLANQQGFQTKYQKNGVLKAEE